MKRTKLNTRIRKILSLMMTLILCLTWMIPSTAFAAAAEQKTDSRPAYAEGEAIVCLVDDDELNSNGEELCQSKEYNEAEKLLEDADHLMSLDNKPLSEVDVDKDILSSQSVQSKKVDEELVLVKSDTMSTFELIEALEELPNVNYACPNTIKYVEAEYYDRQWAYNTSKSSYGLNVPKWNDQSNVNAPDVVVAVLDTGVDYTHEDLSGVMWKGGNISALQKLGGGTYGLNASADRAEAKNKDSTDPMDQDEHGTHCAGIIAAQWNNKGVSGAANGAKIMAVAASVPSGSSAAFYGSDLIQGMEYIAKAKESGVNVVAVNNSWGGDPSILPYQQGYIDAINKLKSQNIIACFAAGNEISNTDISYGSEKYLGTTYNKYYEAYYFHGIGNTMIIGSHGQDGTRAWYSNYGKNTVDVFAPGGDSSNNEAIYSTIPNSKYAYMQGTSMACPAAVGAVAILRAQYPGKTMGEIINAIKGNVKLGNPDIQSKCEASGYIDVDAALKSFGGGDPNVEVEHYKEKIDGSFELAETENLVKTVDTTYTASAKTYTGFTCDKSVSGTVDSGTVPTSGKLELKLYYTRNKYTVTYTDGVSGTEVFADQTYSNVKYGAETPAFSGTPTRTGYTFSSWDPSVSKTVTADATYKAKWNEETATLTYKDGNTTKSTVTQKYSEKVVVANALTKSGYIFTEWNSVKEGGGAAYQPGDVFKAANLTPITATLYARWRAPVVKYDANGHGTAPKTQDLAYESKINAASAITAEGVTFDSWNTKADGKGTKYAADAQLKNSNKAWTGGDITLYAQWKENIITYTTKDYTGVYDGEYHTGSVETNPSDATIKYGAVSGTYNLSEAPTYKDAGEYTVYWQASKSGYPTVTGTFSVKISKGQAQLTKKPSIYTSIFYEGKEVSLIKEEGAASNGTVQYAIGSSTTVAPQSGWTANASSITADTTGSYNVWYKVVGDTSFDGVDPAFLGTAVVSSTTYDVTYNKGDADTGSAPSKQTKEFGKALTLSTNSGNLAKNDKVVEGNKATIKVYMNDGTSDFATLYSTPTTTTEYTAIGWGTSSGTTVKAYDFGESYTKEAALDLYPAWSENASTEYSAVTLPSDWTRPGYIFMGFATSEGSSGKVYGLGETFIPDGDLELFAQWVNDHEHVGNLVTLKKASFTADGNTEYYECKECGYCFADEACTQLITDKNDVIIPKAKIVSNGNLTYNGKKQKPNITVTNSNGDVIPYSISGSVKNIGKTSVKVKINTDLYNGTKTYSCIVNPKGTSISKLKKGSKSMTVTWKKQSAKMSTKRITGYKIQIATDKNFTKGVKSYTVKGYSKTSKTIKSLKSKKLYYVRIRTYYSSYYSKWSGVKTVTTK